MVNGYSINPVGVACSKQMSKGGDDQNRKPHK